MIDVEYGTLLYLLILHSLQIEYTFEFKNEYNNQCKCMSGRYFKS